MIDFSQYFLWINFDSLGYQEGDVIDWILDVNIVLDLWIYFVDVGLCINECFVFNQEVDIGGCGNILGWNILFIEFLGLEDYLLVGYMSDVILLNNMQWLMFNVVYLLVN